MTCRNWTFTAHLNEMFTDEEARDAADRLKTAFEETDLVVGAVFQLEVCPETQRKHIQGFANLKTAQRMTRLKTIIESVTDIAPHLEKAKNVEASKKYCSKEETRMEGTEPYWVKDIQKAGQGKRNELLEVKKLIDAGKTEREVADAFFGAWCRNHKAFDRYRQLMAQERDPNAGVQVEVMVGPPGCGKTRAATEENPGAYMHGAGMGAWFDMYDPVAHKCVVFDDFYGTIPYSQLLNLIDRYPCKAQCKGGVVNFCATKIVLTSNRTHISWYQKLFEENRGDPNAFVRRVTLWRFWVRVGNTFEERQTRDYEEFSEWVAAFQP